MSRFKVVLVAGCAALTMSGAMAVFAPAQAGESTGRWRDGSYATPYGIVRPNYGYGYGYRSYHHRDYDAGDAVAAGVVGGLALGALASRPAYGYPSNSAYPTYYGSPAYDVPPCYMVRRRFVDDWGRVVIRRDQVCE